MLKYFPNRLVLSNCFRYRIIPIRSKSKTAKPTPAETKTPTFSNDRVSKELRVLGFSK